APLDKRADKRDRINDTWMGLRRLNQKLHSLLLVATQADAAAAWTDTLTRDNFADDKRKYGHVTGMVAINQNKAEDEGQTFRIGWLLGRDLDFPVGRFLHTAGALALADPMVVATC